MIPPTTNDYMWRCVSKNMKTHLASKQQNKSCISELQVNGLLYSKLHFGFK